LSVYPNPVGNEAQIYYTSNKNAQIKISLYNIMGQSVQVIEDAYKIAGSYQVILTTSNLRPGVYYIEMQSEFGIKMQKVMINK
jgi:hypothetical protein